MFQKLKKLSHFLWIMPALIYMMIIAVIPMVYSLYMSFHNYSLVSGRSPIFNAGHNFILLFQDPRFLNSFKVTGIYSIAAVSIEILLSLGIALLLNFGTKLTYTSKFLFRISKFLFIIIIVTPLIVAAFIWKILFNPLYGPLNYILSIVFGFPPHFEWLSRTETVLPSLILADIWQWTPFVAIALYAGLQAVPPELLDAAKIDGASYWGQVRHIFLPFIKSLIILMALIRFMDCFKLYDYVYILTRGGPGTASETLSYYTYTVGFKWTNIGYASAMSWVILLVIEAISLIFIYIMKKKEVNQIE